MEIQKVRRVVITIMTILVLLQLVVTIFLSKSIFSSSVFLITTVCIGTIFIFLGYIYTLGNKRLFNLCAAIVLVSIFIIMILTGVLISPKMLLFWGWELFLLILLISIVLVHRHYKLKLGKN